MKIFKKMLFLAFFTIFSFNNCTFAMQSPVEQPTIKDVITALRTANFLTSGQIYYIDTKSKGNPTTFSVYKEQAEWLNNICNIDIKSVSNVSISGTLTNPNIPKKATPQKIKEIKADAQRILTKIQAEIDQAQRSYSSAPGSFVPLTGQQIQVPSLAPAPAQQFAKPGGYPSSTAGYPQAPYYPPTGTAPSQDWSAIEVQKQQRDTLQQAQKKALERGMPFRKDMIFPLYPQPEYAAAKTGSIISKSLKNNGLGLVKLMDGRIWDYASEYFYTLEPDGFYYVYSKTLRWNPSTQTNEIVTAIPAPAPATAPSPMPPPPPRPPAPAPAPAPAPSSRASTSGQQPYQIELETLSGILREAEKHLKNNPTKSKNNLIAFKDEYKKSRNQMILIAAEMNKLENFFETLVQAYKTRHPSPAPAPKPPTPAAIPATVHQSYIIFLYTLLPFLITAQNQLDQIHPGSKWNLNSFKVEYQKIRITMIQIAKEMNRLENSFEGLVRAYAAQRSPAPPR